MKKVLSLACCVLATSMLVTFPINATTNTCELSNGNELLHFDGISYMMEDGVPVTYIDGEQVTLLLPLDEYKVTDPQEIEYINQMEFDSSLARAGTLNLYEVGDSYSSGISMAILTDANTPIFNVSITNKQGIKFYPYNIKGNNTITTKIYFKDVSWNEDVPVPHWYSVWAPSKIFFSPGTTNSSITQFYIKFIKAETEATDFDYTVTKVQVLP